MALVRKFEKIELEKDSWHKAVDATYSVVRVDGEIYLQIDTYGSSERQMVGKKSQSIRLTKGAALDLASIINTVF